MFAYCNNAPVCLSDDDGTDPYGALTIVDYYFIHRMVQAAIRDKYFWYMEVVVYDSNMNKGRLDLYDSRTNSFYEVKSDIYATGNLNKVNNQIERYKKSVIIAGFPFWCNPKPGTVKIPKETITYGKYDVTYWSDPNIDGLIRYCVHPSEQQQQEQHAFYPAPVPETKNNQSFSTVATITTAVCCWEIVASIGHGIGGGGWNINDVLHHQMA